MKKTVLSLSLFAAGALAARAQTGNVGIGTATPGSKLQVVGSFAGNYTTVTTTTYTVGANDYYIVYGGAANGTFTLPAGTAASKGRNYFIKNTTAFTLTVNPAGTETIDGNAAVTLGPGEVAQIVMQGTTGNGNATSEVASFGTGTVAGNPNAIAKPWNTTGNAGTSAANNFIGTTDAVDFVTRTNGTEKMRITSGGNVGVANTAPGDKFVVGSTANVGPLASGVMNSVGYGRMGIANVAGDYGASQPGDLMINQATTGKGVGISTTGGGAAVYVANDNNVGIGNTTPHAPLQFSNATANRKIVLFEGVNNDFQYYGMGVNAGNYRFQTDGGGDFTFNTANALPPAVATGSNELVRIKTNGNVGIGTSAPNHVLDLGTANGGSGAAGLTSATGKKLAVFDNAAGTDFYGLGISSGYLQFHASSTATSAPGMVLASTTGNVGIATGTTAPGEKLQVGSTAIAAPLSVSVNNAQGQGRLGMANVAGDCGAQQPGDLMINSATAGKGVGISTTAIAAALYVANAGNVGIGTGTPHAPLQLSNATANRKIVLYETANDDHQFYGIGVNTNTLRYQTDLPTSDHVFFSGNGAAASTELMRIKGTGNVGIGTSTPGSTLQVNGSLAANYNQVTAATYTMAATDFYVVYNGTTASTITLPAAGTGTMKGRLYTIKNTTAAQTLTVAANGTETIDGTASFVIAPGNSIQLVSTGLTTGATWEVVNFAATTTSTGTTLYTGDGTLSGNRTVTMGASNLNLSSTTGTVNITGNQNSLARTSFLNSNTGTSSRTDIAIQAGTTNPGVFLGVDNSSALYGAGSKAYIDNRSGGRLAIGNTGAEALTVATSGNIGIGNSTPNAPLQFSNGLGNRKIVLYEALNNNYQFYGMGVNGGDYHFQTDGGGAYTFNTANALAPTVATGSNELMRIQPSGNVGIGTNNPNSTLHTNGSVASAYTTTSTNLTLNATHHIVRGVQAANTAVTLTLPTAAGIAGREYVLINSFNGGATLVLTAAAGQVIAYNTFYANTYTLYQGQSTTIISDGVNWILSGTSDNSITTVQNITTPITTIAANNTDYTVATLPADVSSGVRTAIITIPFGTLCSNGNHSLRVQVWGGGMTVSGMELGNAITFTTVTAGTAYSWGEGCGGAYRISLSGGVVSIRTTNSFTSRNFRALTQIF